MLKLCAQFLKLISLKKSQVDKKTPALLNVFKCFQLDKEIMFV